MYRLQSYLLAFAFLAVTACDSPSGDSATAITPEMEDSIGVETDTIHPEYRGDGSIPGGGENGDGTGEGQSPFTVMRMVELNEALSGYIVYVRGYIVGSASRSAISGANFGTDKAVKTNLLIADSPRETNPNRCVSVGLDTDVLRGPMNLVDNPHRLGQVITVCGVVKKYMYIIGIPNPIYIANQD